MAERDETSAKQTTKKATRKRGRPKGKTTKSASFRLPEPLLDLLADEAELQERSQTTILKRALEKYLKDRAEADRDA